MSVRLTRRKKVLVSRGLNPRYRQTVASYCRYLGLQLVEIPFGEDGRTDIDALSKLLDKDVAAVAAGYPNYFGVIEDLAALAEAAHAAGARLIASVSEPIALGLLKPPAALGADIVTGEGQGLGLPLSFGGPYLGFFATRQQDVRGMPGRLVGETVDNNGQRGFVLTLATREQHIRREKATSNICSNQGLCALMSTVFMALLGKQGLRDMAEQNLAKAAYTRQRIAALDGFSPVFDAPVFNEFVIRSSKPLAPLLADLEQQGILPGISLGKSFPELDNCLLVCVTEQKRRPDIDALVAALGGAA